MPQKGSKWGNSVPAKKASKRIVIDTSVAQSAGGEEAAEPCPKQCRDFLYAVRDSCHRVVLTPDILIEWKKHRSGFTYTWLYSMVARKKIASDFTDEDVRNDRLRAQVDALMNSDSEKNAVWKDMCLIEAALVTDKLIASRDETVRYLFARSSRRVWELREIVWVNPTIEKEHPVEWLEAGAPNDTWRQLGFSNNDKNDS